MDPYSFCADSDPDPAVCLNADPDQAALKMWIQIQVKKFVQKKSYEEFSFVVKHMKDFSKVRINGPCANLLLKSLIKCSFY